MANTTIKRLLDENGNPIRVDVAKRDILGRQIDTTYETIADATSSHNTLQTNINSANTAISNETSRATTAEGTNATNISTFITKTAPTTYLNRNGGSSTITGTITPSTDNSFDLGSSTAAFKTVYAGTFSGNAATSTKLATPRSIGGVAFDGTVDITLPGVNAKGNQDTTGTADKAAALTSVSIGSRTCPVYFTEGGKPSAIDSYEGISARAISDSSGNQINTTYLKLAGGTITGDIIPNATGKINLGSSTLKFNNIYGTLNGNAATADKLSTGNVGSINSPVYFSDGKPIATQISFDLTDDNLTINF
jgi:hypothetical protein